MDFKTAKKCPVCSGLGPVRQWIRQLADVTCRRGLPGLATYRGSRANFPSFPPSFRSSSGLTAGSGRSAVTIPTPDLWPQIGPRVPHRAAPPLTEGDLAREKQCPGAGDCGWLFLRHEPKPNAALVQHGGLRQPREDVAPLRQTQGSVTRASADQRAAEECSPRLSQRRLKSGQLASRRPTPPLHDAAVDPRVRRGGGRRRRLRR